MQIERFTCKCWISTLKCSKKERSVSREQCTMMVSINSNLTISLFHQHTLRSIIIIYWLTCTLTIVVSGPQISFTLGNAEDLSTIPDNSQDLYTIAFGIRNCTHVDRVLKEAYRVLKPGGVFSCLEFGKVSNPLLAKWASCPSIQVINTRRKILTLVVSRVCQSIQGMVIPGHSKSRTYYRSRSRFISG